MNHEKLNEDQLIPVKTSTLVKPRPPSATSIPAILKSLQDEWDAVMLHSFTLRQQLQTARQELSHALYQHDAACRVIARLTKEVTAAREALATLKPQTGVTPAQTQPTATTTVVAAADQSVEAQTSTGMTEEILTKLQDTAAKLTSERKKRGKTIPEGLASTEQIQSYRKIASKTSNHSPSVPGILSLDICPKDTNKIITGGNDKTAVVYNKETDCLVATLKGHSKKVTHVVYHPEEELAFTASPDQTIRVWGVKESKCAHVIRAHEMPVTGISLHATGDYLLSCSLDGYWAFSDIRNGRVLTRVGDKNSSVPLTCAQFHPDGLIFGTGTEDSTIKIWDLKEQANVANFPGDAGPITSISFSENGYYLATAADDSTVKLWDLRKLKNFKNIQLDEGYEVKSLCFDHSGSYLGVAGTDVRVYVCKQWSMVKSFYDHTATATGIRFGENSNFIASTGMDRALMFYAEG
ncbi:DgyrCDS10901 [Dimorphilus gyrociliatus]|nr:DgyrCDS10901 [Dimorphilus gyrociliatus]